MNLAHVHLILNHLPVVGIPIALGFLVYGVLRKDLITQRFALIVLFAVAAVVVPIYLTGEAAEEAVEHLAGVSESSIEAHEDAAMTAMILTLIAGTSAFASLWLGRHESRYRLAVLATMILSAMRACLTLTIPKFSRQGAGTRVWHFGDAPNASGLLALQ